MSRIFGGKPVNSVVNTGLPPGFVNPSLDLSLPVVDNHSGKKSINVKNLNNAVEQGMTDKST